MSLKDKAFEAIPKDGIHPEVTQGMFAEKVILLSDAEEEIEELKFYIDQIPESGKAALKEIQTLVELLKYTGEELAAIRNKSNWGYSTSDDVYHLQKKITQTLKKYDHRG